MSAKVERLPRKPPGDASPPPVECGGSVSSYCDEWQGPPPYTPSLSPIPLLLLLLLLKKLSHRERVGIKTVFEWVHSAGFECLGLIWTRFQINSFNGLDLKHRAGNTKTRRTHANRRVRALLCIRICGSPDDEEWWRAFCALTLFFCFSGRRSLWRSPTASGTSCRLAGRRRTTPSSERTMSTTTPVSFSPHHPVSTSSVNELRHQSASRSGLEAAQLHEAKDRQVYGTLLNYTVVTVFSVLLYIKLWSVPLLHQKKAKKGF